MKKYMLIVLTIVNFLAPAQLLLASACNHDKDCGTCEGSAITACTTECADNKCYACLHDPESGESCSLIK